LKERSNAVVSRISAILLVIATGLALAPPQGSMAQEPSDHELAYAIGFRADYGLDDGMALVRSTFQNPEAYPDNEWGLPLSRVEAEDLRDRTWLRRLSQPAVDYAWRA